MEDIFRTLPKILRETEDTEPLRESLVFAAWKRIAGESLGKNTVPLKLNEKHLSVAVPDETWERHLRPLSGQMIFRLNSLLGAEIVTFIDFYIDRKQFAAAWEEKRRKAEEKQFFEARAKAEITPQMRQAADEIKDERLRELFLQAAGNCLVRKKDLYS